MNTGLTCFFIERSSGEWYYLLENSNAPKNAYDWRDYASAFGPFKSQAGAREDLNANHPDPGGASIIECDHYSRLSEGQKESYEDLMKHSSCPVVAIELFFCDH